METFSALLALWVGNSQVTGEFPSQRPVMLSFDVFFDLHQNKRLSKQSKRRWFKTPSRSLWRDRNATNERKWYIGNMLLFAKTLWRHGGKWAQLDVTSMEAMFKT